MLFGKMSLRILFNLARNLHMQRSSFRQVRFLSASAVKSNDSSSSQNFAQSPKHDEVKHHENLAKDWWYESGPMRALHALNSIRVPFIRDGIIARGQVDSNLLNSTKVLSNQRILEVGCGGGILTEQLARLGATVTGIDLGDELIRTAKSHLNEKSSDLSPRITYKAEAVEKHVQDRSNYYDAIVVSEVLEHVEDKPQMLTACVHGLKPGGSLFITTLNKTLPMWFGGIVLGESILKLAPPGTHHWDMLISPLDVQRILDTLHCQTVLINGSTYDFWNNTWRWINSTDMCYALQAIKVEES